MAGPLLAAAPYVLQGLSLLGGVVGKKKKYLDEESLRQLYGPRAIGKDTTELAQFLLSSPYGQQLLAQAAETGQGLQTEMAARAAASGLSPDTGGQSGAGDFAISAGTQAQGNLERQTKAGIYESALPIAADLVKGRMGVALNNQAEQNAQPSMWQRIGAAAGQAAATMAPGGQTVTGATAAQPASSLGMSMLQPGANGPQGSWVPPTPSIGRAMTQPQFSSSSGDRWRSLTTNARSAGMRRGLTGGRR